MLPSAAREDLSPEPPPPALGTDKKGVVGQGGDGGFFLGSLTRMGRTRMGKESHRLCRFERVSGMVSPPDRKRFGQRTSSSSSELSIFTPAGAPI